MGEVRGQRILCPPVQYLAPLAAVIAVRLSLSKTAVSTRTGRGRQLLRNIAEQERFLNMSKTALSLRVLRRSGFLLIK